MGEYKVKTPIIPWDEFFEELEEEELRKLDRDPVSDRIIGLLQNKSYGGSKNV